jgi:hypothetical protein
MRIENEIADFMTGKFTERHSRCTIKRKMIISTVENLP